MPKPSNVFAGAPALSSMLLLSVLGPAESSCSYCHCTGYCGTRTTTPNATHPNCAECAPGTYNDDWGDWSIPKACNAACPGKSSNNSLNCCKLCPSGKFGTITGATSFSACYDCAPGTTSEEGATECVSTPDDRNDRDDTVSGNVSNSSDDERPRSRDEGAGGVIIAVVVVLVTCCCLGSFGVFYVLRGRTLVTFQTTPKVNKELSYVEYPPGSL